MPNSKNILLEKNKSAINKLLADNKDLFLSQMSLAVFYKENKILKGEYTINHKLFLKSEYDGNPPEITIQETWKNDELISYTYRFCVPCFEYCFARRGASEKVGYKTFDFRYEVHGDKPDHKPKEHLHVLDNVPPSYQTHKIDFGDFLEIIKRDFTKNNKISFQY